jgi:hypothetical protein
VAAVAVSLSPKNPARIGTGTSLILARVRASRGFCFASNLTRQIAR